MEGRTRPYQSHTAKNKIDIEQLNFEADKAEREGDYARVAEFDILRLPISKRRFGLFRNSSR